MAPTSDPKLSLSIGLNLKANKGDLEAQIKQLTQGLTADINIKIDPQALKVLNDFAQSFNKLNDIIAEQTKSIDNVAQAMKNLGASSSDMASKQMQDLKTLSGEWDRIVTTVSEAEQSIKRVRTESTGQTFTQIDSSSRGRTEITDLNFKQQEEARQAVAQYQTWVQEQINAVKESGLASNAILGDMSIAMKDVDATQTDWNDKIKEGTAFITDIVKQVTALGDAIAKNSELLQGMLGEHPDTATIEQLIADLQKLQVMKTDNFKTQLVQITDQAKILNDQLVRTAESADLLQLKWNDRLAGINTSSFTPEQMAQYNAINQAVSDFNTTASNTAKQSIDYQISNMEKLATSIQKDTLALQKFNYELESMNADLEKLKANPWADQGQIGNVQSVLNNPAIFNSGSSSTEVQRMRDQIRGIADDAKFSENAFSDSVDQMIAKTKQFVDLRIMSAQQAQTELAKYYKANLSSFRSMTDEQIKMIQAVADMQAKASESPGFGNGYRFKGYAFNPIDLTKAMVGFQAFQGLLGMGQDFVQIQQSAAGVQQVLGASASSQSQLNDVVQQFIGIATQYGASVTDVLDSAKLWGRQYKDLNEVINLTNEATLLSVVDNLKVADANKAVESSMNAMGMATGNANEALASASKLVDSWSAVSHDASVSAQDLTGGFERSAAAAKQAGLSVDQLNALIAVGVRNTGRSGQVIGNMWKSVLANLESGTPKVQQAVEALGVKYDPNNIFQMILDISKSAQNATPDMSKYFEAIAGGKYQYDSLRASIANTSAIMQAYNDSLNSAGAGAVLAQTQMHTLSAEIQRLKDNIQGIMYGQSNGGVTSIFKDLVVGVNDLITGLNNLPSGVTKLLEVLTVIGLFGASVSKLQNLASGTANAFVKMASDIVGGYQKIAGIITGTMSESETNTAKYLATLDEQSLSAKNNTQAINVQTRAMQVQNEQLTSNTADTTANTEAQIANTEARTANAEASTVEGSAQRAEGLAQEGQALNGLTGSMSEAGAVAGETTTAIEGTAIAGETLATGAEVAGGATMGLAGLLEALAPVTMGVTAVLGLLVAGLGVYAIASGSAKQKTDELNKALQQQQSELQNSYNQNPAHIDSLVNQYGQLDQATNGGTKGSASQLQQYYQVTQQLGQLLPTTINYIDTEGKYHLMNANNIKQEIDQINNLNKAQLQQQNGMADLVSQYQTATDKINTMSKDNARGYTETITQDTNSYASYELNQPTTIDTKTPLSQDQIAQNQLQIQQYKAQTEQIKKAMSDRADALIQGQLQQQGAVNDSNLNVMQQIVSLTDWTKAGKDNATMNKSVVDIVSAIQQMNQVTGSGNGTLTKFQTILQSIAPQLGLTKDEVDSLASAMQNLHDQQQAQAVDWSGLSDSINTIITNNQTLYQAQQEMQSQGQMTQATILALTKTYGVDFVNAMNAGTSATNQWLDAQVNASTQSLQAQRQQVGGMIQNIKAEIDAMEAEQQMAQKGILQQQLKQELANNDTADARYTAQAIQYYQNGSVDGYSQDQDYQNAKSQLASLQAEYGFLGNEIDNINQGAQDATSKTKTKVDQYQSSLDAVNNALSKQEAYVKGLDNTSQAYRNGLQKEIDLLNQKSKLLQQDISSNGGDSNAYASGRTGGGGSGVSASTLNKLLSGTSMAGLGGTMVQYGNQYGIDPALLYAIAGAEQGFKNPGNNNLYGLMKPSGGEYSFSSIADSIKMAAQTLANYAKDGLTSVGQIQSRWAPVGASNDPNNLNANWVGNVNSYLSKTGDTSGGSGNDTKNVSSLQQQLIQTQQQIQQLNDQIVESRVNELNSLVSDRNSNIISRWKQISQTYSDGSKQQIDALKNLAYWQNNSEYWIKQQMDYIAQEVNSDKISEAEKEKLRQSYEKLDTQLLQMRTDEANTNFQIVTSQITAQDNAVKDLTKSISDAKQAMSDWQVGTSEYNQAFTQYITGVGKMAQHDVDMMNFINQQLQTNTNLTQAQQQQLEQDFQNYQTDYETQQNNILQIKKNIANQIVNAEKNAIQQEMKLMDQQHTDEIKNLQDEKTAYDALIQAQIDSIDQKEKNQQYQEQLNKDQQQAQLIQNQLNALSVDNSSEAMAKKADLTKQLSDLETKIADEQHKHQDDLTKQNLTNQKNAYDNQNKAQQDALNTQFNNAKQTLQNILDDTQYWDNQVTQIMEGSYQQASDTLNGLLSDLQNNTTNASGNFTNMASTIQSTMGQAGQSIQSGLIDNLQTALQLMQQLQGMGGLPSAPSQGSSGGSYSINPSSGGGSGGTGSGSGSGSTSSQSTFHNGYDPNKMPLLKEGTSSQYVKTLQTLLNQHFGYHLAVDGVFGTQTLSAVEDFQKKHGLSVDGLVGSQTWRAVDTFDTGGYTGDNVPASGALAVLHGKELVLDAKDTQNILEAVKLMRNFGVNDLISGSQNLVSQALSGITRLMNASSLRGSDNDQASTVTIHMPIKIDSLSGDEKGARDFFKSISDQLKRKGVVLK